MCRYKFRRPNGTPINALAESVLRGLIPEYERKRCQTLAVIEKYLSEERYKRSGRFKRITRWLKERLDDDKYVVLSDIQGHGMLAENELRYVIDNCANIRYLRLTDGTEMLLSKHLAGTDSLRDFIAEYRTRLTPANIIYIMVFDDDDSVRTVYDEYYRPDAASDERVPQMASRLTDVPDFLEWLGGGVWHPPASNEVNSDSDANSDEEPDAEEDEAEEEEDEEN